MSEMKAASRLVQEYIRKLEQISRSRNGISIAALASIDHEYFDVTKYICNVLLDFAVLNEELWSDGGTMSFTQDCAMSDYTNS